MFDSTGLDSRDDEPTNRHHFLEKLRNFPWLSVVILGVGGLATLVWVGFLAALLWTLLQKLT